MLYMKLTSGMDLVVTSYEPIYRGDHLNQKITFLIPVRVGDINIEAAAVYLSYVRADGTADIALLVRDKEKYNEQYFQYYLPVISTLSRYPGEVCMFLQIFSGPPRHPTIAKSGECILRVIDSKNMDEYITDRNLRLIYEMQRYMEDKLEEAETTLTDRINNTDDILARKADNLIFNPEDSTIQLVSTVTVKNEDGTMEIQQIPLGEPIYVCTSTAVPIADMEINTEGNLIAIFDDETTKDLGRVVGKDGAVYVPNVDGHKVLTFTLEDPPGTPPGPVDLNPFDEWEDMDGSESGYIWEYLDEEHSESAP